MEHDTCSETVPHTSNFSLSGGKNNPITPSFCLQPKIMGLSLKFHQFSLEGSMFNNDLIATFSSTDIINILKSLVVHLFISVKKPQ